MSKVLRSVLPWIAAGVAGIVATPAVAVAAASVDWYGWLDLQRRQEILHAVARVANRLGLDHIGCALRRHASWLPSDQQARAAVRTAAPGDPPPPATADSLSTDGTGQ